MKFRRSTPQPCSAHNLRLQAEFAIIGIGKDRFAAEINQRTH
jgi:hypothetical protein